jgi:hypothetical protein
MTDHCSVASAGAGMHAHITNCSRVLIDHPDALVTKIAAWLGVADLGRCMRTCREWNVRCSDEELWRKLCAIAWRKAKLADCQWHKRWGTIMGRPMVDSQYGQAARRILIACPPKWAFPGDEEEAAESSAWVRPSTLAEVLTWRGSLRASAMDLKRTQITDQELAGSAWALRFRLHPGANTAHVLGSFFRKDRKFVDAAIFPAHIPAIWSIQGSRVVLDVPEHEGMLTRMVFAVTRLPNWGWHLFSSQYKVEMMSMFDRALIEAAAEGYQLEWPRFADELVHSPDHEAWKEYDVYAAEDEADARDMDDGMHTFAPADSMQDGADEDSVNDDYAGCYDSPAQYPESEQSDADHGEAEGAMTASISPRTLQRTLNNMLLYDSYDSDDLTPAPQRHPHGRRASVVGDGGSGIARGGKQAECNITAT